MGRLLPCPLSAELSALRQQAVQRLATASPVGLTEKLPDELLYQTMLALQQEELCRARTQIKVLQQAAAVAAAPSIAATDPDADKFRRLFEHSSDAVFLLLDNYFVDCNAAMLALVGATSKQQILGRHIAELAPSHQPDGHSSRELANEYCRLAVAQGRYRYEWRGQRCSGEEFWGEILITPVQMDTHTLLHAVWRDITPLKVAEQRRRESEEDRRRTLEAAGVGTIMYSLDSKEIVLDERARVLLGLPSGSGPLTGKKVVGQIYPEDVAAAGEALARAQQSGQPLVLEFRVVWADRSVRYIRFRGEIDKTRGQLGRLLGVVRDISATCEAQQELSYKNRLLEHIVNNMPVVLTRLNHTGVFLEQVGLGLRPLSIQDNQLRGDSIFDGFPAEAEHIRRLLTGDSINTVSFVVRQGQGIFYQNYGFFDQEKQEAVIFSIDVTESEQTREKLHAEKVFTKQVLDHSLDALIALDLDLRVTAWNQTVALYSSIPEDQAIGHSFFELLPHHLKAAEMRNLLRQVTKGKPITFFNQPLKQRPGSYDIYFMPLHNSDRSKVTGILVTIRDITERNRMLTEAVHVQRQQQQIIVQAVFAAQEAERKRIAEALHNGVGQLLYVTKLNLENGGQSTTDPAVLQVLNEAIQATRNVSHQLTPGILEDFGLQVALQELVKHIPPGKLKVYLHLTGLHQSRPLLLELAVYRIIQELLSNVIKHAHAREVHIQVEHEDKQVVLSVQDDGQGMPVSPAPTSDPGMGIISIRNRAELFGGRFSLESHPEWGTTVRVALPVPESS